MVTVVQAVLDDALHEALYSMISPGSRVPEPKALEGRFRGVEHGGQVREVEDVRVSEVDFGGWASECVPRLGPVDVVLAAEVGAAEEVDGGGGRFVEGWSGAGEVDGEADAWVGDAEGGGDGAAEAVADDGVR